MSVPTMKHGRIVLVGGGRMGCALLRGWLENDVDATVIDVLDPQPSDALLRMQDSYGFQLSQSILSPIAPAAVVMCVKPQVAADVAQGLSKILTGRPLVVSIMAGTSLADLRRYFPEAAALIRAMPNLAASVGKGMTVAVYEPGCTAAEVDFASRLLSASGGLRWLADERLMNAATAVSGSGPGYIFLVVECLARAGVNIGLAPDLAEELARAVVTGSGVLLERSGQNAGQLRRAVTSPGGTTAAGLAELMSEDRLQVLFDRTVRAAVTCAENLRAATST